MSAKEHNVAPKDDEMLDDLDSLLEPDSAPVKQAEEETPVAPAPKATRRTKAVEPTVATIEETSEDADKARIEELKARLTQKPKQTEAKKAVTRPVPESQLTETQREIRKLEDLLAKKIAAEAEALEDTYENRSEGVETLLIHVVADGLVINGQTTYRGQEFEFEVGGIAWQQTVDRNGFTYLSLADDVDGQFEYWGEQKIAVGPWRGRKDVTERDVPSDIKDAREREQWLLDTRAAVAAEQKRNRSAPVFADF